MQYNAACIDLSVFNERPVLVDRCLNREYTLTRQSRAIDDIDVIFHDESLTI